MCHDTSWPLISAAALCIYESELKPRPISNCTANARVSGSRTGPQCFSDGYNLSHPTVNHSHGSQGETLFGAIVSNKMMSRDRRDQSKPLDTSTCGTAIAWITTRWLQPAISSHL